MLHSKSDPGRHLSSSWRRWARSTYQRVTTKTPRLPKPEADITSSYSLPPKSFSSSFSAIVLRTGTFAVFYPPLQQLSASSPWRKPQSFRLLPLTVRPLDALSLVLQGSHLPLSSRSLFFPSGKNTSPSASLSLSTHFHLTLQDASRAGSRNCSKECSIVLPNTWILLHFLY